jgi:hypothetical protein
LLPSFGDLRFRKCFDPFVLTNAVGIRSYFAAALLAAPKHFAGGAESD